MLRCAALLTLVALAAACGQAAQAAHHHVKTTSSHVADAASLGGSAQYAAPKPWYRRGMHRIAFQSPTGNIRCAVKSHDPKTLLCTTLNNGNAAVLDAVTGVQTDWTVTIPGTPPVLRYHHVWWSEFFWCDSEINGTYCRSLYSRHGFLINRDAVTPYVWKTVPLHFADGGGAPATYGSGGAPLVLPWICADGTIDETADSLSACQGHGGLPTGAPLQTYGTIPGNGYAVICNDGWISYSGGIQGACSWHGGESSP